MHTAVKISGVFSLALSMLIFPLAVAPFTPSVILVLVTIPLAILAASGGAWRMSILALLWSVANLLVSPMNRLAEQHLNIGAILVAAPVLILCVSGFLYANYRTHERAA